MTIFSNDKKSIQFTPGDTLYKPAMYGESLHEIEMPKIICTNKDDAEYIQEKINEFARRLVINLIVE